MNEAITIDAEFAGTCPPLSDSEANLLEQSIITDGCRDPIVVWNGIIVDGHNRFRICTKLGIKFQTVVKEFDSREEAKAWILTNQLSRRNLGFLQLAYLRGCWYRHRAKLNARCSGYTQAEAAKHFRVSSSTIRSDRELAGAIDGFCEPARKFVLSHGAVVSRQQVLDFSKLSDDSQKYILDKIDSGYLAGIRDAVLRLRPPARTGRVDGQRRRHRCKSCGALLAEGVFTCLACDLTDKTVRERVDNSFGHSDDDDDEVQERIAAVRQFKEHADQVEYAAEVITEWMRDNEVEKNTSHHATLVTLLKTLMKKVGVRRETDRQLRILIDAEGGDRPRYDALTPNETKVFTFIREFGMKNGRPPKLREIADQCGCKTRSHVQGYIKQLISKGIIVRD